VLHCSKYVLVVWIVYPHGNRTHVLSAETTLPTNCPRNVEVGGIGRLTKRSAGKEGNLTNLMHRSGPLIDGFVIPRNLFITFLLVKVIIPINIPSYPLESQQ